MWGDLTDGLTVGFKCGLELSPLELMEEGFVVGCAVFEWCASFETLPVRTIPSTGDVIDLKLTLGDGTDGGGTGGITGVGGGSTSGDGCSGYGGTTLGVGVGCCGNQCRMVVIGVEGANVGDTTICLIGRVYGAEFLVDRLVFDT